MLETIFGLPIIAYYFLGLLLFMLGMAYVVKAGKRCWHDVKDVMKEGWNRSTGRGCITSIKHLGIYWIILAFYLFMLLLISIYVIVYGFTNGWNTVSTLDLATSAPISSY